MWVEPVYDRTPQDVAAKNKKGVLNYADLNRIEGNTEYLSDALLAHGYLGAIQLIKTDWQMTDMIYLSDMNRILANCIRLNNGFFKQKELPTTLQNPDYIKINTIEEVQQYEYDMINEVERSYRYCGTFYSGQMPLPQLEV